MTRISWKVPRQHNDGTELLWFLVGVFCGAMIALTGLYFATDQDTPVALEPKCETIIIHRDWR